MAVEFKEQETNSEDNLSRHDTMENASVQPPIDFAGFLQRMKDWQILAIPVVAIVIAEMLLYTGKLEAGIFLHVMIPLGISISSMWMRESNVSFSLQTLVMLSILRLVNISMPVFFGTTLYMYIFIYTPLLIPTYIIMRHQRITPVQMGFTLKNLYLYIPLALAVGYFIGLAEYNTINAHSMIPDVSPESLLKLSFVMFFFVGFVEELIFRSLLQTRLQASLGMEKGLVITSILFGMMHSGYGNVYELLLTASAGIVIGYMFQRTGSLPLVTLAHGFVNVFLFGLIPLLSWKLGLF